MKTVAVVVTYNRVNLLKNCIGALLSQPKLASILVVDNDSTDGTFDYINKLQKKHKEIVYRRLNKNVGGAGGFAEGIQYAFESMQADNAWLMDDDGVPLQCALVEMLKYISEYEILNALVLNEKNRDELAFNVCVDGVLKTKLSELQSSNIKFIPGEVSPFNSTLISKSAYKKIGLPKKHYFIWGDETEYILRAKRHGVKIATACRALHTHPMKKNEIEKVLFGILGTTDKVKDWKYFWYVRNKLDYLPNYYGWRYTLKWAVVEFIKNVFTFKFKAIVYELKAIYSMVKFKLKNNIEDYV
jgi:rhamnopyranosyl-N-acetylglucosaminyl-diphospho-decaprenol beta-1,3/1,4-galactofuranosyltransferase